MLTGTLIQIVNCTTPDIDVAEKDYVAWICPYPCELHLFFKNLCCLHFPMLVFTRRDSVPFQASTSDCYCHYPIGVSNTCVVQIHGATCD